MRSKQPSAVNISANLDYEGYYLKALEAVEECANSSEGHVATEVRRAYLLERIGRKTQSRALLNRITKTYRLTDSQRSVCEHTIGRIEWEEGQRRAAVTRFNDALALADRCSDLGEQCWSLMSLLLTTSDSAESTTTDQLLTRLRSNVMKLGDPRLFAALHETLGRIEGKRGLLRSAKSHFCRALQLLETAPHVYLHALIELELGVIAGIELDVDVAVSHSQSSLEFAEQSGSLRLQRASLANLAFCRFLTGDLESAVADLQRAEAVIRPSGDVRDAMFETLARVRLSEGSLDECARILETIENNATSPDDRLLWAQRHAALTRARLLARQGRHRAALKQADRVLDVSRRTRDTLLFRAASLEKANIHQDFGQLAESLETLASVTDFGPSETPELLAEYESSIACALLAENKLGSAEIHRKRAERMLADRSQPGLRDLSRRWEVLLEKRDPNDDELKAVYSIDSYSPANAIQQIAALLTYSARPALFAQGMMEVLSAARCTVRAAVTTGTDESRQTIATLGEFTGRAPDTLPKRVNVRTAAGPVDVWLEPKIDAESTATVNAIATVMAIVGELERSRAEREQQMRLWPIEDVDLMNDHAVVGGAMRGLMAKVRRVATTTIPVLLTGESGTGKEIFARAIHAFSTRSTRPFVPFNCAALPRDMVESQLFGHRRGAFTGADRDNPGVIRAARGGTLFLDEIGELALDLQPKLLRFLESMEICPLGETTPFTVDVRIVSATNAKLEQAVRDGRFRDDLFYRLHGVRLDIPPLRERRDELPALVLHFLARAAAEFKKGHVRIAEETMEQLVVAPWPGNIRQLQNELRRMVALAEPDAVLTPASLSPEIAGAVDDAPVNDVVRDHAVPQGKLHPMLERIERQMVKAALDRHRGKMDDAAKALGISRKGLYLKRQRLGL